MAGDRLRIGIDCRSILRPGAGEAAGVGHYVHHLTEALLAENDARPKDTRHEFVLFFDSHDAAEAKRELHFGREHVTARVLPFRRLTSVPFVYSHLLAARVFEAERLDVLHGPANVVPLFYRRPWVVTVHDLAIYDHPEWFPAEALGTQGISKNVIVPHSINHARRVIAVSEATKKDILRLFEVDARRVDVVYEGALFLDPEGMASTLLRNPSATPSGSSTPSPRAIPVSATHPSGNRVNGDRRYFLSLGTIEPRKNLTIAVRAFTSAAKAGAIAADVDYVIAGGRGWKEKPTLEAIAAADEELGGTGRVRWIGYLPHDQKHAALAGALALVFPSFKEGFGLPVLEAMAAGTPVIASDIETTREVAGDAALLAAPTDMDAFARAMAAVAEDSAGAPNSAVSAMVARARERAAQFTWQRAARETLRCYEAAAETVVSVRGHDAA